MEQVKITFPNAFAVTIADENGAPYYENFDGLIGEICIHDIQYLGREWSPQLFLAGNITHSFMNGCQFHRMLTHLGDFKI